MKYPVRLAMRRMRVSLGMVALLGLFPQQAVAQQPDLWSDQTRVVSLEALSPKRAAEVLKGVDISGVWVKSPAGLVLSSEVTALLKASPRLMLDLTGLDNEKLARLASRHRARLVALKVGGPDAEELTSAIGPHIEKLTRLKYLSLLGSAVNASLGPHLEKLTQLQGLNLAGQ